MSGVPYSPEEDATILRCYQKHNGKQGWLVEASKLTGRQRSSVMNRWSMIRTKHIEEPTSTHAAFANAPLSLKQVIKLWDIDTDVFEAVSITPRKWDIGAKHPETGEILVKPLYGTMVVFKRKKTATAEIVGKQIVADIEQAASRKAFTKPAVLHKVVKDAIGQLMVQFNLFDIHLAKYAWAQETGQPYDIAITERVVKGALSDLLSQVPPGQDITQCLLPFGNDYFQTDTLSGTTTAGTQVDHDTRFQKMYRHGHALAMWMIEECAKIAPVHVPVIPGNHDATAAFTMGVVLEAEFRRNKHITFDNGPAPRKYYRFGKNLLGFAHGDKEPASKLPQIMSVERPQDWADSVCREFHIGHFHHGKKAEPISVDDQTGVTVRWIRSLSAADSWHTGRGYVGNQRSAEAFVWRKAGGMRSHIISLPVEQLVA